MIQLTSRKLTDILVDHDTWLTGQEGNGERADLADCDLTCLDLRGINLAKANLLGADLRFTDFTGANLSGARMTGVDARWVKFINTDLKGASFMWVKVDGANFTDSDFRSTIVTGTDFTKAKTTRGLKR